MNIRKTLDEYKLQCEFEMIIKNNMIYIYFYDEIVTITDNIIVIRYKDELYNIAGKNLSVIKFCETEIIISGELEIIKLEKKNVK